MDASSPRETRTMSRPRTRVHKENEAPRTASNTTGMALAPSALSRSSAKTQTSRSKMKEEEATRPFMGQLSATQTQVVTTTTTTTTCFPPLLLNPPRQLPDMDPKQYPLASAPTPASVKKFSFDVGGSVTTFEEAGESYRAWEKGHNFERSDNLKAPTIKAARQESSILPPANAPRTLDQNAQASFQTPNTTSEGSRKRRASPISISEAALRARQYVPRKRRILPSPSLDGPSASTRRASSSRLRAIQTSTPITPNPASNEASGERFPPLQSSNPAQAATNESKNSTTAEASDEEECQILSPRSEITRSLSFQDEDGNPSSRLPEATPGWERDDAGFALTPNPEEEPNQLRPSFASTSGRRHPRPNSLNTTASQDASLPSPSLSPVTAAANLQHRRSFMDQAGPSQTRPSGAVSTQGISELQKPFTPQQATQLSDSQTSSASVATRSQDVDLVGPRALQGPLMNLPDMIDTFEAMPEEMKSYIMYQMLRRCSKPVLHFVADVVNPALKCDFLRNLPLELCINILGNLDLKSLCAAAQVSRHWRQLVDSSEKVWKRLFDTEGFQLQEGELARAIREGWGWQFASNFGEYEKDLSNSAMVPPDTNLSITSAMSAQTSESLSHQVMALQKQPSNLQIRRSKRKAKSKTKFTSRKQHKSSHSHSSQSMELDDEAFLDMVSATEGPYAAASAALAAVPFPEVGLPTLRNLHLFKSLYMRHHIIRSTWMNDEVAPRHIAFRAHQRHVVTCLQFDSDKILTGSDDSNINVYDTQTGALRATLEGHDGGVWALQYEGNVLVSGSTDRSVRVWDIERGACTHTFQGHTSTVRCLQILMPTQVGRTADGRPIMMPKQPLIITGSRDSHLRVWKLPKSGDKQFHQAGPAPDEAAECPYFVRALTGHHHSVRAIAAHADTLVSGSYDCTVRVWKISTGETLHRLQGHTQKVYSVVLDHKRNRCISGSMDNFVRIWSLETGASLYQLDGHTSLVGLLDLQQDRLVSAAADSTLRLWNPENGQCNGTLSAHTGAITCFQHDGQKVISGSDRTLKMWDVTTGKFVKDLLTDLSGVWQVKFNERRCVAAVQRNNLTYIEVLDFGALRDGIPEHKRGRRIVINVEGRETFDLDGANQEEVAG